MEEVSIFINNKEIKGLIFKEENSKTKYFEENNINDFLPCIYENIKGKYCFYSYDNLNLFKQKKHDRTNN